ncbi:HNH endonuclease [Paraburkholderia sp.]|uniref:HNH endonuclease n=1 Tax=Paraburkholderia sp. TaxID=1926495 RepID=UPI0039E6EC22
MSEEKITEIRSIPGTGAALRHRLLEKHNHRCVACGITDDLAPLELAHLVPLSRGGELSEDNLTILCANCHRSFDRPPREIEFVSFLAGLLTRHRDYSDVQREIVLGREIRYRADILAHRRNDDGIETLLIECKTYPALTAAHIHSAIGQLEKYKAGYGDCRMVLAIPATLREEELSALRAANIEAWDLRYIASRFSMQIRESEPGYYRTLLLARITRPKELAREQELINSLESCVPGKSDCYVYQTLVGEILECLFTPPLGKPIPELSDKSEANRRDFIMPNYTERGFWSFMRQKYEADYIVIDAKNYTRKIKKSEVLQIANYLKPHGAGLFGLIISRRGGDSSGCEHTLREQWLIHRKLILVLDDEDIKAMLMAKSDERLAEDVLGQKIEHFRLSM